LQALQVKIDYLLRQAQHSPHSVMQQENPRSSIAVKEIFVSVLPLLNVYLALEIQYQLVHR
jgi:hypothetical protein